LQTVSTRGIWPGFPPRTAIFTVRMVWNACYFKNPKVHLCLLTYLFVVWPPTQNTLGEVDGRTCNHHQHAEAKCMRLLLRGVRSHATVEHRSAREASGANSVGGTPLRQMSALTTAALLNRPIRRPFQLGCWIDRLLLPSFLCIPNRRACQHPKWNGLRMPHLALVVFGQGGARSTPHGPDGAGRDRRHASKVAT
jgi:hypothetical protein